MERQELFTFVGESATAIAVQAMNDYYPNVVFEGVETGTGQYTVTVRSKYNREPVPEHTMRVFRNEVVVSYRVACVAVNVFELEGKGGA